MSRVELSDAQWCFLDLLARAKSKGVDRVTRAELLATPMLPDSAKIQIVFGGLLLSTGDLVTLHKSDEFEITEAGLRAFNTKFGKGEAAAKPSKIADVVIALPDRSMERVH